MATDKITMLAQLLLFKGQITLQEYEDWRCGKHTTDLNDPIRKQHKARLVKWLAEEREKRGILINDNNEDSV